MSDKTNELLLIEMRGSAPLVRTRRAYDGQPAGTLGCIVGVDGVFLLVQLAGGGPASLLTAMEVEPVE